jgi:N-acyl homoserine lactone hydrolase
VTVILAGQSHAHATAYAADQLVWRAERERGDHVTAYHPAWIDRLMEFDPQRVLFAHDQSVWEPD